MLSAENSEDDEATHVIFSLTVQASRPILALESLREGARAGRQPQPGYEYFYAAGRTASFVEGDSALRAEKLEVALNEALDLIEATGVDDADLRAEDVFVRAFFTFGRGAETISADLVERLARIHATIWIDAVGDE